MLLCLWSTPAAEAQQADDSSKRAAASDRAVYIPLDELETLLPQKRKSVFLPLERYRDLSRQARDNDKRSPRPESEVVVSQAEYRARIADRQLLISAEIALTQFADGWQRIVLPLRGLALEEAQLDGEPARLGRDDKLVLFNDKPGRHTLRLELSTRLRRDGSDRVAAFGLVPIPSAVLSVTVPAGRYLQVDGALPERPSPREEPADYRLAVGGRREVRLRLTDRPVAQTADSLVFATTLTGVHAAPEQVSWHAATTLDVYGQPIERLTCRVPRGLEITEVRSTGLETWTLEDHADDPAQAVLALQYRQPFGGSRQIEFKGLATPGEEGRWRVPNLAIEEATSHVGRIAVRTPRGVRMVMEEMQHVRPVAAESGDKERGRGGEGVKSDAPPRPLAPSPSLGGGNSTQQFFDFWSEDFVLQFVTRPKEREVLANMLTSVGLEERSGTLDLIAEVECVYVPLFHLDVALPAEWVVTGAQLDGRAVGWQAQPTRAGVREIRIPLDAPLKPGRKLVLTLRARRALEKPPGEEGRLIELPEVRLPDAGTVEGGYLVRADANLDVTPVETTGLDPVPLSTIVSEDDNDGTAGRPAEDESEQAARLAYRYQNTRFSARVRLRRRSSRIAAQSVIFARIDRREQRATAEITLDVEGGGTDLVGVALPETAGTDLRFELTAGDGERPLRLVEQRSSTTEDERIWMLRFDRPVRGRIVLAVEFGIPQTDEGDYRLPGLRVLPAARQNGYIALETGPARQLDIRAHDAGGRPLREVDRLEMPETRYTPQQRVVAVYRYVRPDYQVEVSETRFDPEPIPTAVCHDSALSSEIAASGERHHRAVWTISAVGVQSLRARLPEGTELWAALIDRKPVPVRRIGDAYRLPLSPEKDGKARRTVELFYHADRTELGPAGTLEQRPPQLAAVTGEGAAQPLPVLQQDWILYHSPGMQFVDSRGPFRPTGPLDRVSLLERLRQGFAVGSLRELWWELGGLAVTVVVVLLPVLVFRRWRWAGLGGLLAVVGLLFLCLFALLLPATQQAREAARIVQEAEQAAGGEAVEKPLTGIAGAQGGQLDELSSQGRTRKGGAEASDAQPSERQRAEAPPAEPSASADREKPEGARLSVLLDYEPPAGLTATRFRSLDESDEATVLSVDYQHRKAGAVLRAFVAGLVLLVFWLARHRTAARRGVAASIALTVPLVLTPFAPVSWHLVLDGLFFGALAGVVLWGIRAVAPARRPGFSRRSRTRRAAVAAATLMILTGAAVRVVFAAPPEGTATAAEQRAESGEPRAESGEQNISDLSPSLPHSPIVPYDRDEDPLAADRVLLPYERFLDLWNRAHPERRIEPPAPVAGTVAGGLYSAELATGPDGATQVAVTGRIVLHSFREQRITLPVPLGRVAIDSAQLDGAEASLVPGEDGASLQVVVDEPGQHVLDVEFTLPVELYGASSETNASENGQPDSSGPAAVSRRLSAGEFSLPLRAVPTGRFSFELPARELDVRVAGSPQAFRIRRPQETEAGTVEVPVDSGGQLTIEWRPQRDRGDTEALVHAEAATALTVGDAGLSLRSGFALRVRRGATDEAAFSLPEPWRVRGIDGPEVGGWEFESQDGGRTLRIFLRRSITDETRLTLDLYRPLALSETAVSVEFPRVAPLNVVRESGVVGVFAGEQLALEIKETAGLTRIDADRFQSNVPEARILRDPGHPPPEAAYRYAARPLSLRLQTFRRQPKLLAEAEHGIDIGRRKIALASRFALDLQEAPRSRLAFRLPEGYLPLEVDASGLADWYTQDGEEGDRTLVVELATPREGNVPVVLRGTLRKQPDDPSAAVHLPAPLQADRLRTQTAVWVAEEYAPGIGDAPGWNSISPEALSGRLRGLRGRPVRFAFRSTQMARQPLEIRLERRTPRLAVDAATVVTVTDTAVHYALTIKWRIRQAAADRFTFVTPERLGTGLDVEGRQIRRVDRESLEDGRVRWSVVLQEPVTEEYVVVATTALPPPAENEVAVPQLSFAPATPEADGDTTLETVRQYAVVVNGSHARLVPGEPDGLDRVAGRELPLNVPGDILEQAIAVVRIREDEPLPVWRIQQLRQQRGAAASINLATLRTVVAPEGTWRTRAVYEIRNLGRQFVALRLPEGSQILSVFVKGRPSRAVRTMRNGRPVHLVALPKISEAELSFPVQLTLAGRLADGPLPEGRRLRERTLQLPAPQVVSLQDDEEYGIPVARTIWRVHLPEDQYARVVEGPDQTNLTPETTGEVKTYALMSRLQETKQLLGVIRSKSSRRVKREALENVQQRERELAEQTKAAVDDLSGQQAARLQKELGRLQAQRRKLADDRDGEAARPRLQELEERAQRRELARQSRRLLMSNSMQPGARRENTLATGTFRFGLKAAGPQSGRGSKPGRPGKTVQRIPQSAVERLRSDAGRVSELNKQLEQQTQQRAPAKPDKEVRKGERMAPTQQVVEFPQGQRPPAGEVRQEGTAAEATQAWTEAGGLSLEMDLPTAGQSLRFSKAGGGPRLTLALRPRESLEAGLGLIWSLVWLAVGLGAAVAFGSTERAPRLVAWLPKALLAAGVILFVLAPAPVSWIGFTVFVAGLVWLACRFCGRNA